MLNTAATLRRPVVERHFFDPTNTQHLRSLDTFLKTGNWGDVQFYPELPFVEVPITVLTKFALHERKVEIESSAERQERFAAKNLVAKLSAEGKDEHEQRLARSSARVIDVITADKAAARLK